MKDDLLVLACEGSELKGYTRKQANSKNIKKHMTNGGMNSFNFHSSPRMVPHVFRPEVQFLEMSIEEFVPRGKKVKDDNTVTLPVYKTKLTNAETNLLAKYFAPTGEIAWRPSLIAFPHFQAFPSPVNKVVHSSRTGILIDTMQYLQGLTFSTDSETLSAEDEEVSDPCLRVEVVEHHEEIIEDSERPDDPAEDKLKTEALQIEVEEIGRTKDMYIKNSHKQKPCRHTFLFGSEFVSVDDFGNVLVLSLPQLPLEFSSKCVNDSGMAYVFHSMDNFENHEDTVKAKGNPSSQSRSREVENLIESSRCNPDVQEGKLFSGAEKIIQSPISSGKSKEMDICGQGHNGDESSDDSRDCDLSPRLTNFIKSGIVPESPVNNSGTRNGDRGDFMGGPAFVSFQNLQTEFSINTWQHDEKTLEDNAIQTPVLNLDNNAPGACKSPVPVAKETQTPLVKLSNTSSSKDWLLDSGVKAETVEQQCKFRRLRKHGDLNWKLPPESKIQAGPSRKLRTSRVTDNHTANKLVKGEKKRAKDVAVFIEEEAEVSSEDMASDDEENEQVSSSYEDSFIDDGVNPASASTQAGTRTDMMAIYRRSLLSQSPFQRLPDFATNVSPDSVVQSSRMDESGSSSGAKHDQTPQIGLESTARNSQLAPDMIPSEMVESKLESRKRKLSFYQAQSVPMVNLENEFSLLCENAGENSSIQVERPKENIDVVYDDNDDDQFYEGIDLDAVEEEAAKLLRYKSEGSTQKVATVSEPIGQNPLILGSPTFDLGV
ncbi:hypothetical protein BUALT_Bualt08G0138100 [Buddleja alternifolia]|uniref:Uncharacterized protein n=1 Tax=Buddleja alternifolia TaxID=168488 RepID=A0AAV6X5M5_9LAMI|nr:hypothetical protein BUALT_Bualt08G0138100 [Buddleja alternifolia]